MNLAADDFLLFDSPYLIPEPMLANQFNCRSFASHTHGALKANRLDIPISLAASVLSGSRSSSIWMYLYLGGSSIKCQPTNFGPLPTGCKSMPKTLQVASVAVFFWPTDWDTHALSICYKYLQIYTALFVGKRN